MELSRRQQIVGSIVFFVVVTGFLIALAEGAIRLRQWLTHGQMGTVESLYVTDHASGLRVARAGYRSDRMNISAQGFRGPDLIIPKPDGTIRIAFLGASTTICSEITDAESWPQRVVERLRERYPDRHIDFLNAGVPGYLVESTQRAWRMRVKRFDPDIVVVYHATNDLSVDSRAQAVAAGVYSPDAQAESWLAQHSLLWELAEKNLFIRLRGAGPDRAHTLDFDAPAAARQFQERVTGLVRELKSGGRIVVLPTFAYRVRRGQAPDEAREAAVSALYYMPYLNLDGLLDGYEAYNGALRAVAVDTGALLVGGELEISADAEHFTDSVHFAPAGSAWMANRVADALMGSADFQTLLAR